MANTKMRLIIFFVDKDGEALYSAKTRPGAEGGSDHKLLFTKSGLELKKGRKTTRPFRYDLNQSLTIIQWKWEIILKGLDLTDRVPDELWTEVRDTV